MPEKWTGVLIGKMHNARVSYDDLAAELGLTKGYRRAKQRGNALGYERANRVCKKGRRKRKADHDDLRPCRARTGRTSARSAAKGHERGICDPPRV